jgi:chaperonin GroEL
MKERKWLLEDAKNAVQAALESGVVPGGGVALIRAEKALDKLKLDGDEKAGAQIIKNILDQPLRAIAQNAGVDGAVVVNRVRQLKSKTEGYDADKDEYGDMLKFGVIDPAKVVTVALQNAVSVASLLLTTEALVTEIPKEKEDDAGGHDHHDHGMGGMGGMGGLGGMEGMM